MDLTGFEAQKLNIQRHKVGTMARRVHSCPTCICADEALVAGIEALTILLKANGGSMPRIKVTRHFRDMRSKISERTLRRAADRIVKGGSKAKIWVLLKETRG